MPETSASIALPENYTNRFINFIHGTSVARLLICGVLIYVGVVIFSSILFYGFATFGQDVITKDKMPVKNLGTILYFNFITILTVGYGDLAPVGVGRFLAVLEALTGVGLFGLIIGVVIIKFTNPSDNSIVFSRYCYYALDEEKFFIHFVNTNKKPLINVEMSYVVKIGNWKVRPSITSPYVGKSVWTFFLPDVLAMEEICNLTLRKDDGFKFGLTGSYGFASYVCYIKYFLDEILVIKSRNLITKLPILEDPVFGSQELEEAFHYTTDERKTFKEYALELDARGYNEG